MEFRQKFHVFQIVSYQLNHISGASGALREVYLDHFKQFVISFKTFENIQRNVPRKIPCSPDCIILEKCRSYILRTETE